MPRTIRVACPVCDGSGEILSHELGRSVVCWGCLGAGFYHEDAPAPACDVQTHDEIAPAVAA